MSRRYIIGIDEVGRAAKKRRASPNYIIGIDEVGRGALAGPVTVAAVAVPAKLRIKNAKLRIKGNRNSEFLILNFKLAKLRDSKKLSSSQREVWFDYVKNHPKIFYAIASVSPRVVDKINVSRAANLAAGRVLKKIVHKKGIAFLEESKIFLDGGLYLSGSGIKNYELKIKKDKKLRLDAKTVIKGDEKIPAISLASIVAKVTRDNKMMVLGRKHLAYSFFSHKGYGTKKHFQEINVFGVSRIHRLTFLGRN